MKLEWLAIAASSLPRIQDDFNHFEIFWLIYDFNCCILATAKASQQMLNSRIFVPFFIGVQVPCHFQCHSGVNAHSPQSL